MNTFSVNHVKLLHSSCCENCGVAVIQVMALEEQIGFIHAMNICYCCGNDITIISSFGLWFWKNILNITKIAVVARIVGYRHDFDYHYRTRIILFIFLPRHLKNI